MNRHPSRPRSPLAALLVSAALIGPAVAQVFAGDLYYSRYNTGSDPFRVKKVAITYDGANLTLGAPVGVARNIGADGLVFTTRGSLLVAGQGNRQVCEVNVTTGAVVACSGNTSTNLYHVTMAPGNDRVFTSAQPGTTLFEIPINPAPGTPIPRTLRGGGLTQIVFTPTGTFYTASAPNGAGGVFGTIDMSTYTLTPKLQMDGFHGVAYDRYTGHVITFGSAFITQITADPVNPTVVSRLDIRTLPNAPTYTGPIDQGTTTGNGLVLAAVNGDSAGARRGQMVFLDIRNSRRVATPDFAATPELDTFLDDIAPLSGAGCSAPARTTAYGTGWPGRAGVPSLGASTPFIGQFTTLSLGNAAQANTAACLLIGTRQANLATAFDGRQLVDGITLEIGFVLAASGASTRFFVPASACGSTLYTQLVHLDSAATRGVAFSAGLRVDFGN